MRTIMVALAVALVTASSSTAAFVVTSKNIKNGTIQLVDINPRAKKALRGQPGPRGIQEVTLVTSPPMPVPPGSPNARVEATCPDGELPISGAFKRRVFQPSRAAHPTWPAVHGSSSGTRSTSRHR